MGGESQQRNMLSGNLRAEKHNKLVETNILMSTISPDTEICKNVNQCYSSHFFFGLENVFFFKNRVIKLM